MARILLSFKIILILICLSIPVVLGIGFASTSKSKKKKQYHCDKNQKCVQVSECPKDTQCFPDDSKCGKGCSTTGPSDIPLSEQQTSTIQIVNSTSENPLHVFVQTFDKNWEYVSGNGKINPTPLKWVTAWNPLGSKKATEIILRPKEYIVLAIPDSATYIIMPIKFKQERHEFLTLENSIKDIVYEVQYPVLVEGGKDRVLDTSAVDGINFRLKMELTTTKDDDHSKNSIVTQTQILKNPCKTKLQSGGCINPVKDICKTPTCDCCPSTQKCRLNKCSFEFFNVSDELIKYKDFYDLKYKDFYDCGHPYKCCTRIRCDSKKCPNGCTNQCKQCVVDGDCKPEQCCDPEYCPDDCNDKCKTVGECNDKSKNQEPVKQFINDTANLKTDSALKKYCDAIQKDNDISKGDFVTYCYDYNDLHASKYLRDPYKCKIEYFDL